MKNGDKNKSVAFIILFSIINPMPRRPQTVLKRRGDTTPW